MSFNKLFEKKENKKEIPTSASPDDETGYICSTCGRFNPMRFIYCPYCGTKAFSSGKAAVLSESWKNSVSRSDTNRQPRDRTEEYLQNKGLLGCADLQYQVHVALESGLIVTIPLFGRQSSNDALQFLIIHRYIEPHENVRFSDWPRVDYSWPGPSEHHRPDACVCELNHSRVYHLEHYSREDLVCLYGCPNPKSIAYGSPLNQAEIVVVDYEK